MNVPRIIIAFLLGGLTGGVAGLLGTFAVLWIAIDLLKWWPKETWSIGAALVFFAVPVVALIGGILAAWWSK